MHFVLAGLMVLASATVNGYFFGDHAWAAEDTTAPTFSIAEGAVIAGAATEVTITEEDLAAVTLDGADGTPFTGEAPAYKVVVAGEGAHTLIATDREGNSSTLHFTLDATAPVVSLNTIDPVVEGSGVVVAGTVDDPAITNLQVLVNGIVAADGVTVSEQTFTYTIGGLGAGSYTVTVKAKDAAGNEGTSEARTAVVNVPPDTTPPVISVETLNSVTVGSAVMVKGTVDADITTIYIQVDGVALADTATAVGGVFNFPITGLSAGTHKVVLKAIDAAGNVGLSEERAVTIYQVQSTDPSANTGEDTETAASQKDETDSDTASAAYFLAPQIAMEDQASLDKSVSNREGGKESTAAQADTFVQDTRTDSGSGKRSSGLAWYW